MALIVFPLIIRSSICRLLLYKIPSGADKFNCDAVVVILFPDIVILPTWTFPVASKFVVRAVPVSYTHLTLPTIYSV